MAASTGKVGLGVTFEIGTGTGAPETFAAVANVTSVSIAGRTVDEIDFTHLQSTGFYREFRPGFREAGTITVGLHFDPGHATITGTRGLQTLFDAGTVFNFRVNFEGAGYDYHITGTGFVQNPGDININPDDPMSGDATIRVTGPLTIDEQA